MTEKIEKKKEEKRIKFIVGTNVVANWPPEHQLTGTPHTRDNRYEGIWPLQTSLLEVSNGKIFNYGKR